MTQLSFPKRIGDGIYDAMTAALQLSGSVCLLCASFLGFSAEATAQADHAVLDYNPRSDQMKVQIELGELPEGALSLVLPTWTRNRREPSRRGNALRDLQVEGRLASSQPGEGGWRPVALERRSPQRWALESGNWRALRVQYRLKIGGGRFRRPLTNNPGRRHLWCRPGHFLLGVDGHRSRSMQLDLELPDHWTGAIALARCGPSSFLALDRETLDDAPLLAGPLLRRSKTIGNTEFELAVLAPIDHIATADQGRTTAESATTESGAAAGEAVNREAPTKVAIDEDAWRRGWERHARFVKTVQELFPSSPRHQKRLIQVVASPRFEGAAITPSTVVLSATVATFRDPRLLFSLAQGHLVRMHFEESLRFGRADLSDRGPRNARGLWFEDGFSNYYAQLLRLRGGSYPIESWLRSLKNETEAVLNDGRHRLVSPADIGLVVPERRPNARRAGFLIATALDLEIRNQSKNRHSLDDLIRSLRAGSDRRFDLSNGKLQDRLRAEFQIDPEAFFARHVDGTMFPPLARGLRDFGVDMKIRAMEPRFPFEASWRDDGLEISKISERVSRETGLRRGDFITEVSGKASYRPEEICRGKKVGSALRMRAMRSGESLEVSARLIQGRRHFVTVEMIPRSGLSPKQILRRESWLRR